MSDKPNFMADDPGVPCVFWYPDTRQIEVRVETAMLLCKCHARNSHAFEEFKAKVYKRLNQEFNEGDMNTLIHARFVLMMMVEEAKQEGCLVPFKDMVIK